MIPFLLTAIVAALALFGPVLPAKAADLHVAAQGNDRNPGSSDRPLRTWQAAIDRARPGDTIHVAPGLYRPAASDAAIGVTIAKSGTPREQIRLLGAGATLDCGTLRNPRGVVCLRLSANWWIIRGIAVTGARQGQKGGWAVGFEIVDGSHNLILGAEAYDNHGPGFVLTGRSRGNHLVSCAAYRNYDPLGTPAGGNADGFQITRIPPEATGNRIVAGRSFENSDDGYDLWHAEAPVTIERSVAIGNGFVPTSRIRAGDGVGFKLGENRLGPQHFIRHNLARDNRCAGFARNNASAPAHMRANRATGNGAVGC